MCIRDRAGIEGLLAFGIALTGTSLMLYVTRDLGLGTGELGLVFALGGLGAVLGGSLAPRLGRRLGPGRDVYKRQALWCPAQPAPAPTTGSAAAGSALSLIHI